MYTIPPSPNAVDAGDPTKTHNATLDGLALLKLLVNHPLARGGLRLGLDAHDAATPGPHRLVELVVVGALDGFDELGELHLVLVLDAGERERGGRLLVHDGAEASLPFDDAVGHVHLAAERGEPDDELDGVDVVRDAHELRLALLHEVGDVVDAKLDHDGLLGLDLFASLVRRRGGDEALLLLRVILGAVLHEELEELGGEVLVEGVVELLDGGGNLEALLENAPGSLDANVLGPLDVAVQRRLGLERLADAKHLGLLLEEGVGVLLLSLGGLHARGGGGDLLSGGHLSRTEPCRYCLCGYKRATMPTSLARNTSRSNQPPNLW
mmetsp:Transcript_11703/g.53113  ORF Transcript_11703/g.53113 Transcript_11703/m.53113 type:complete len:324 (+) Transcript_11703:79-1050(+)